MHVQERQDKSCMHLVQWVPVQVISCKACVQCACVLANLIWQQQYCHYKMLVHAVIKGKTEAKRVTTQSKWQLCCAVCADSWQSKLKMQTQTLWMSGGNCPCYVHSYS